MAKPKKKKSNRRGLGGSGRTRPGGNGVRITRVTKIRDHRVFRNFAWPSDLHCFGHFNLIYGWNGCGKSTLSTLFAHLEKRTNLTEGELEFEFDESRKCSGSQIVSNKLPSVRVFNSDFINATITAAVEGVDPVYYLGKDSIEKQAKLDELKAGLANTSENLTTAKSNKATAETKLDTFCIDKAKMIKEILTGSQSTDYNNYDKRRFKQSVTQLNQDSDSVALLSDTEKERLRKQKDAQPKGELSLAAFGVPDFSGHSAGAQALLERSVASETLEELIQDKEVGAWVQQGLVLHSRDHQNSTCRFCAQPLSPERRAALEGHFNDAFAAFQIEITERVATLDREITQLNGKSFPDSARAYDHLQAELSAAVADAQRLLLSAAAWLGQVRDAFKAKKAAPFDTADPAAWQERVDAPDPGALTNAVAAVNAAITKHNSMTSDFQNQVVKACGELEQHYVAEALEEYTRLTAAVTEADGALGPFQKEVERLQKEIADIERDIVEHQRPADELNNELRAYLGRDELRFEVKETGYALTRAGQPVSDLSEGERTAIAFLYFLKSLQDRAFDLPNGVVVIDDPVSSLDTNSLFSAFGYMKERTKGCGQLFVLTHNFGFFRQVRNWFHHLGKERVAGTNRPCGCFFFMEAYANGSGARNSAIRTIDPLLYKYESEYHYLFRRVYDQAKIDDGPTSLEHHYSMPNVARRLVEAFLAFRYPHCPGDLARRLDQVDFDGGRKTRILRFLNTYSHSSAIAEPEHDPSILAETRPVLCDVLEMIKMVDPTHYEGMKQLVDGNEATP